MYIAGVDCSWLNSPFWRRKFLLTDPEELAMLNASSIAFVTIDLNKGAGPAGLPTGHGPAAEPELVVERRAARRAPVNPRNEVERARATVERSKAAVTQMFGEARLGKAVEISEVAPLVDEIAASMMRDRSAMLSVTRLKTKDEYTYMHSVAVCALMINLGRQLGLNEAEVRKIGQAGLLHDIGKMGVPEEVLGKPGKLDDAEFAVIRGHPQKGHALLKGSAEISDIALDVCLHHHEKVDGTGYPFGLDADQLSLHARMGAICDVYDAVTSERPYKKPWNGNEALARMLEWEGHFDAEVLQAFIRSIGIHPRDALVRLHSNRLAVVLGTGDNPNAPAVQVFYRVPDDSFCLPVETATCNSTAGDPIIREEGWAYWFGEDWRDVLATVKRGELVEHNARIAALSAARIASGGR